MPAATNPSPAVLFVCLGNICRSPMAEGAFRAAAQRAGLDVRVDSVGTANYHVGEPPDPRAIATAAQHGVDIAGLKGRQLCEDDFYRFTDILALDASNLADIRQRMPGDATARVSLLLDCTQGQADEVADPYYGDDAGFEACWTTIGEAVETIAGQMARSRPDEPSS